MAKWTLRLFWVNLKIEFRGTNITLVVYCYHSVALQTIVFESAKWIMPLLTSRGASTSVWECKEGMRDWSECERMPKSCLLNVRRTKRTSKHSAGYSLTAWMNVRPHEYDCERIFLWSTDSRHVVFACLPNIHRISEWRRMLFAYMSTLCV